MRRCIPIILFAFFLNGQLYSIPPEPVLGFRWVLVYDYSDEFNGTDLDRTKWRDFFDGWEGRAPAKFIPGSVSVHDGTMQIRNGVLNPAQGAYTMAGGAVQSLQTGAHYGYYECRFKASRIQMSTTFWLSNGKELLDATECTSDRYSLELDISEVIGGRTGTQWEKNMNANTHYRHIPCGESQEEFHSKGASKNLSSKVWEDYHTYACWWEDANSAKFYADDKLFSTIAFSKTIDDTDPFDRPMRVNMVTETYNWATPYPTEDELNNDSINTSYYDWIRSYKLVKVDEDLPEEVITPSMSNGGFETGDFTGWITWGGNPVEVVNNYPYSGDYAVHIAGPGAPEQVISVKPNTNYTISCYSKIVSGSVKFGLKEGASGTLICTDTTYVKRTLEFTSDESGSVKVFFYAPGEGDEGYADDFEIHETNPSQIEADSVIEVFEENINFQDEDIIRQPSSTFSFILTFMANYDRTLHMQLKDNEDLLIGEETFEVLAGYGKRSYDMVLDQVPVTGNNYTLHAYLLPLEGTMKEALDSATFQFDIGPTGLETEKRNSGPVVYPNPASDQLFIRNMQAGARYKIYKLQGQELINGSLNQESIDIGQLEKGIYFIRLGEGVFESFVKE